MIDFTPNSPNDVSARVRYTYFGQWLPFFAKTRLGFLPAWNVSNLFS